VGGDPCGGGRTESAPARGLMRRASFAAIGWNRTGKHDIPDTYRFR
jgi:hypothetical protein